MIRIRDLEFAYPGSEFRLAVPELTVAERETVAFIGPSGTGKTTLLNLVAGITRPDAGRVTTAGTEVSALGDRERRAFRLRNLGLVFQEFELLSYLDVLDNILLPGRLGSAFRLTGEVRERAASLAADVGIADKLRRPVGRLSQGERQRVAICRAMLPRPRLLLADEPTGNLDPANKTVVLDLLFDLAAREGTTLVAVTHDHDLLGRFDRVLDFAAFHAAVPPAAAESSDA